ncbi:hypothetical protein ACJX0J_017237, partial [Zea mays]
MYITSCIVLNIYSCCTLNPVHHLRWRLDLLLAQHIKKSFYFYIFYLHLSHSCHYRTFVYGKKILLILLNNKQSYFFSGRAAKLRHITLQDTNIDGKIKILFKVRDRDVLKMGSTCLPTFCQ